MVEVHPKGDVTWYFAFCSCDTYRTAKFLKEGFQHVIVFSQSGPVVTALEPTTSALHLQTYYNQDDGNIITSAEDIAQLYKANGFKVVRHSYCIDDKKSVICLSNLWPSCVNVCKVLSGYRTLAQTPYQLFKSLLKDGGQIL